MNSDSPDLPRSMPTTPRSPTSYQRALEVQRIVDGIPVALALQERSSETEGKTWWVLSWRTRLQNDGPNRRFYFTKERCWMIPSTLALGMLLEMEAKGALFEEYFDHRRRPDCSIVTSSYLATDARAARLRSITLDQEDWPAHSFFVIAEDPHADWKKVLIVNPENGLATFRSITKNAEYKPRKVMRPDSVWVLDNSMMDANVQQMRAFRDALKILLLGD